MGMMFNFTKYSLILCFILGSAIASKRSINTLKNKLTDQSHRLNILAAKIKNIEKEISKKNSTYLDNVRSIEQYDKKIAQMKTELSSSAEEISENYRKTKSSFELFLIEKTDEDNENSLLERAIYFELLSKKIKDLEKSQKVSNGLLEDINFYEQELARIRGNEESIYKVIVDLENSKKNLSKEYINVLENKNLSQSKLDRLKIRSKISKRKRAKRHNSGKSDFLMSLPLSSFSDVLKSKKGITFKFNETLPISAPRSGKIAYSGELASYGNVIIIDHGKEVRSVFFGDINIKVSKGKTVNTGDLIGYTLSNFGEQKSLYYEVRKKNKVQNTYNWFSKKNLKKLKI